MIKPTSTVSFKSYGGSAPENYERYFVPTIGTPFATELLDAAALQPGERVLDVACGTGVVTRLAAGIVGPDVAVAGLDINPGMLGVARSVTPARTKIEWHEASAESMPLPDESFDIVVCSLGLQFLPDKSAALQEMQRVLAPGGRLAIGTVGPTPPVFAILEQALARHVKPEVAAFMRQVFSLHDTRELHDLIAAAGFREVQVKSKTLKLTLPAPAEFLWQYVHSTPLAGAVGQIDDEGRGALERDVTAGWQTFVQDGALIAELNVVVSTSRK
jgi:ubiquinone/menaquinone biosynthesis C-methylase UbiE